MNKVSELIERQSWEHDKFILTMAFLIYIGPLLYIAILFILATREFVPVTAVFELLRAGAVALSTGMLTGVVVGTIFLIRDYIRKQWDLHVVVPRFFFLFLLSLVLGIGFGVLTGGYTYEYATGVYGYGMGCIIPILAYSTEVKKEHLDEETSP